MDCCVISATTVYVSGGIEVQVALRVTATLVILIVILATFIVLGIVFYHRMQLLKVCICVCESSYFTLSLLVGWTQIQVASSHQML